MNKDHLSEAEIQQYALGKAGLNTIEHIDSCAFCEAKAANYRLIFSVMDELPQPAFDFRCGQPRIGATARALLCQG